MMFLDWCRWRRMLMIFWWSLFTPLAIALAGHVQHPLFVLPGFFPKPAEKSQATDWHKFWAPKGIQCTKHCVAIGPPKIAMSIAYSLWLRVISTPEAVSHKVAHMQEVKLYSGFSSDKPVLSLALPLPEWDAASSFLPHFFLIFSPPFLFRNESRCVLLPFSFFPLHFLFQVFSPSSFCSFSFSIPLLIFSLITPFGSSLFRSTENMHS